VASKLDYLGGLGVTAIWLSPVFRQRGHLDTYHGYGIQDFLDVDPRFGTREELVALVAAAHQRGIRIILDIIFNHSGANWFYPNNVQKAPYLASGRHPFGNWLDASGNLADAIAGDDDGVWPAELQHPDTYTRAGSGNLGAGDLDDPNAEHKRTDFEDLRDFHLGARNVLGDLARCYKYWIALTDCDGFRIDTLKHVSLEEGRNFCGTIKEYASNLGKENFFLVGEVAGGDFGQDRYLDVLDRNLNAALDIGEMRLALTDVAKGLGDPRRYFDGFDPGNATMGSHRNIGNRHVSILDDHDHVFGAKVRFSSDAPSERQVAAAAAVQLFSLGIPCIYYGTEQALAGPEAGERMYLPNYGRHDVYLREAMFGPDHPRGSGRAGLNATDANLPGFGPFGTAGHHCFDPQHPAYRRIAELNALRKRFPVLRHGRQYLRQTSFLGRPFAFHGAGELVAWSRILDDEEALVIVNLHGTEPRGADVLVDATLAGASMQMILGGNAQIPVQQRGDVRFVNVGLRQPSEVVVLTNR
jgi:glycosidase